MNDIFSINRFWLLMRSNVLRSYRQLMIPSAAVAVMVFMTATIAGDVSSGFYNSWFGFLLFVWGIHSSSRAFIELHDRTRNQAYLLVPASALEKTAVELFKVTIGFVLYLLLLITCVSFLTEVIKLFLQGSNGQSFNPFNPHVWTMVSEYLFLQPFFFLGSIWFGKHPIVKTVLGIAIVSAILISLHLLTTSIFHGGSLHGMNLVRMQGDTVKALLEVLLPVSFWYIAWLRLKEIQVSDGV